MALFSEQFLQPYLGDFDPSKIVNFSQKKSILQKWQKKVVTGRLVNTKEESIKSRFVTDLFGEVLGYAYSNSGKWQLQEELKTEVDSTKSDAAFGFYEIANGVIQIDVRVVVEIKDSKTPLDPIQKNRPKSISPVDQAFLYAAKTNGNCNWIVVSNLETIRFYHTSTQKYYQEYTIESLQDNDVLKEMIFLFQREHLITKQGLSRTDKLLKKSKADKGNKAEGKKHVIDEMYTVLKKFEGLNYVDPEYLCTLYPFNILNEHVWHYDQYILYTLNPEICKLLKEITLDEQTITVSEFLKQELEQLKVNNYLGKLDFIFRKLNDCLIFNIIAIEDYQEVEKSKKGSFGFSIRHIAGFHPDQGIHFYFSMDNGKDRYALTTLYRSLNFDKLIRNVKQMDLQEANLEAAFGNYLIHSHNNSETFLKLKEIESRLKGMDDKLPEYFIAKINLWNGYNVLSGSIMGAAETIKVQIRKIDLDETIASEVDVYADKDVRKYLISLKEDELINKLRGETEDVLERVQKDRDLYLNEGQSSWRDYQIGRLDLISYKLYSHLQKNFIMLQGYTKYRDLATKIFRCYLISYQTPRYGLTEFNEMQLMDAVIHLQNSDIKILLKDINTIDVNNETKQKLVKVAENLIGSYLNTGIAGVYKNTVLEAQLMQFGFKEKYCQIFFNLFTILTRIDPIGVSLDNLAQKLTDFIKLEDFMFDQYYHALAKFIEKNGSMFSFEQLNKIFKRCIHHHRAHRTKYDSLFRAVCKAWELFYSDKKLEDISLIQIAILKTAGTGTAEYRRLHPVWNIGNAEIKEALHQKFDRILTADFCDIHYHELLHKGIFTYDFKDYFEQYLNINRRHISNEPTTLSQPKIERNYTTYNIAIILRKFKIPLDHPALAILKDLNLYQQWLIDPFSFNYKNFDTDWLILSNNEYIMSPLKSIPAIAKAAKVKLTGEYNAELAEIFAKYLLT